MNYFEQHLLPEERNSIPYLSTTVHLLDFISKQYGKQIAIWHNAEKKKRDFLSAFREKRSISEKTRENKRFKNTTSIIAKFVLTRKALCDIKIRH